VTLNDAEVAPAATVTHGGTTRLGLLEDSGTATALADADES
jgi:hypothetical protein